MVTVTVASGHLWIFLQNTDGKMGNIREFKGIFPESWPVNTDPKNQVQRPEATPTEVGCHHYAWSKPRGPLAGYQPPRNWATNSFLVLL